MFEEGKKIYFGSKIIFLYFDFFDRMYFVIFIKIFCNEVVIVKKVFYLSWVLKCKREILEIWSFSEVFCVCF